MQVMSKLITQKFEKRAAMALIIAIKVIPSSGKNKIILDKAGALKIYLKSPPEKGKANQELITILSKGLDLPKFAIEIVGGLTDRNKRIKISTNLSWPQILEKLGIQAQMALFNKKD